MHCKIETIKCCTPQIVAIQNDFPQIGLLSALIIAIYRCQRCQFVNPDIFIFICHKIRRLSFNGNILPVTLGIIGIITALHFLRFGLKQGTSRQQTTKQ